LHKICDSCGAQYEAHAQYCNICKKESLTRVEGPPPPNVRSAPLVADMPTLVVVSAIWLLGLGYLLAEVRPRSWAAIAISWGTLAAITTVFCFVMRNPRMAAIFSAIGLVFCSIYGLLRT
jgi:hypothetical protein